jgi:hypothetical protein
MKKKILPFIFVFCFVLTGYSQIWTNPLTTGRPLSTNYLGDKLTNPWYFNFEIGQDTWNASQVGIGQNADGSTGWSWVDAAWYENGSGSNKHVRRDLGNFQFTQIGTWYVVGRAKANSEAAWTYTDEGGWSNETTLTASTSDKNCPYFTVSALENPTDQTASLPSSSAINLTWTKWNSKNVMVLRKLSSDSWSEPTPGTTYSIGNTIGNATVVYNSNGTTFTDTGLNPGTTYDYKYYSENYSYYSSGVTATETTATTTATDYFRSKATGNWNENGSWESSPNNSVWISANLTPGINATSISILNGHNITLNNDISILNLTINSGGTFTASDNTSRALTIIKSTSGTATTLSNNGTWANGVGGSTVIFTGSPSSGDAIHSIAGTIDFDRIAINKTSGTSNVGASFGAGTSVTGTLEVGSGGYVATAPPTSFYGSSAILKFNQGTGAVYDVNASDNSWSTTVVPNYITISSGTVNLNANRTATGNLLIDGGTLVLNNNTPNLTIQGNWTRTSGSFTAGTGTITLSGTSDGTVDVTGGATMNNLLIAKTGGAKVILATSLSTSTVTVNPGAKLTLNSGQTLTATTFNVQSDATGNGTFIDNGTVSATTANVQQYMATGRNWYISSPVAAATTSSVNATTGTSMVSYNEPNGSTTPWPTESGTLTPMKGYIAVAPLGETGVTVNFSGALNTGNKSIALTRTAGQTKEGFNLVGNPYPSHLNWSEAIATAANALTTIWYRTYVSSAYVFQTYNATGGIGTPLGVTGLTAPMQAFWVRANGGGGTLTFNNSMRSHSATANPLKAPASKNTEQQLLRLEVSNDINTDEAVVYFNSNASNAFDAYDSPKMTNAKAAIPEIYTLAGNEQVVINGLNSVSTNSELPVGFTTGQSNVFSIKATEINNFDASTRIILKDKYLNTEQELTIGTAYNFSSNITSASDRFSIVFKSAGVTTGTNPIADDDVIVYKNADNQIAIKNNSKLYNNSTITIYNAMGQELMSKQVSGADSVIKTNLSSGVYFVHVNNSTNSITKKIIID